MKKRIDLRLWHEGCWMLDLTRTYPDAELVVTDICSDGVDIFATVVLYTEGECDLEAVEAEAQSYQAVRSTDVLESRDGYLRIHTKYDANRSIYTAVVNSALTPIGEITVADDEEHWTLIVDSGEINAAVAELEESASVDIRRVIDYEPESSTNRDLIDEIQQELSPRQQSYLLLALEEGYYSWPRDVSASELAEKHDVSGPTALEHIRTGESRVLHRVLKDLKRREQVAARDF